MTAPVNRLNLVQGPFRIWVATWADEETEPADPATIATTPAAPFVYMGATRGGVTCTLDQTYAVMDVDQALHAADVRLTGESLRIAGNSAEPTLVNIKTFMNSGSIATGEYTGRGPDALTNAIPSAHKVLVDGLAPGGVGLRRRLIARRAVSTEGIGLAGSKTDAQGATFSFLALMVDEDPVYRLIDAVPA